VGAEDSRTKEFAADAALARPVRSALEDVVYGVALKSGSPDLLALRDWAVCGQPDTSDGALSALDKLGSVMPPRLRPALQVLSAHSSSLEMGAVITNPAVPVTVATLLPTAWKPATGAPSASTASAIPSSRAIPAASANRRQPTCTPTSPRKSPLACCQAMARWLLLLNARLTVIQPAELRAACSELATSIADIASDTEATQLSDGDIHTG
jgi:hypothetical protein